MDVFCRADSGPTSQTRDNFWRRKFGGQPGPRVGGGGGVGVVPVQQSAADLQDFRMQIVFLFWYLGFVDNEAQCVIHAYTCRRRRLQGNG